MNGANIAIGIIEISLFKWNGRVDSFTSIIVCFLFPERKNTVEKVNKVCSVYGYDVVAGSTVRKCFSGFRSQNFDLKNHKCPGRSPTLDED